MTEHVRPGDARWTELVADGRDAVNRVEESRTDRNWRLGDAALEIAPTGADASHNGAYAALEAYAEAVGVRFESLRQYRRASEMWAPGTRVPGAGWKVHQILADPERQHLVVAGMTVTQAHAAAGQSTAGRSGPRADAADRARAAADALADPAVREEYERIADNPMHARRDDSPERKAEVARTILADPEVARAAERQADREWQARKDEMRSRRTAEPVTEPYDPDATEAEHRNRVERITQSDPVARRFDQSGHAAELVTALRRVAQANRTGIDRIAECLRGAGDGGIDAFAALAGFHEALEAATETTAELTAKVGEVARYARTGRTDMDAGLDEILRKGK